MVSTKNSVEIRLRFYRSEVCPFRWCVWRKGQSLCRNTTHWLAPWRRGGRLGHQLGPKPTVNKCPSCVAKPGTIIDDGDAIGLVLLQIWDLPLLVPYGAFSITAMQLHFGSLENTKNCKRI